VRSLVRMQCSLVGHSTAKNALITLVESPARPIQGSRDLPSWMGSANDAWQVEVFGVGAFNDCTNELS
jgi:hypothetical protein